MHIHRVIAGSHYLQSVGQFMPVEVGEQSTMCEMIWWYTTPQIPIIIIPERWITCSPVEIRKTVNTLQDRHILNLVDLSEYLPHSTGSILRVLDPS